MTRAEAVPHRILLTGAGGFVGRHLLPVLRAALPGARLVAATRRDGEAGSAGVPGADETVTLDLLSADLRPTIRVLAPDAVVHLAAQASVGASFHDPRLTWRTNLDGTLALAEAILAERPAARLLHISSAEVYGLSFRAGAPLNEDAPMRPANPYAASKAAADLAVGEMALRGLDAVRLRPFNQTGPGQSADYVVAAFARQVAMVEAGQQEPVLRTGALDRWRDFLDVRDVCTAYAAALTRPELVPGTVINLATGTPRRVGDILDGLIERAGLQGVRVEAEAARLRPTDLERTAGDVTAARALLDWRPATPWQRTLDDMLADWRARVAAG